MVESLRHALNRNPNSKTSAELDTSLHYGTTNLNHKAELLQQKMLLEHCPCAHSWLHLLHASHGTTWRLFRSSVRQDCSHTAYTLQTTAEETYFSQTTLSFWDHFSPGETHSRKCFTYNVGNTARILFTMQHQRHF